jgi:hypothetical protein
MEQNEKEFLYQQLNFLKEQNYQKDIVINSIVEQLQLVNTALSGLTSVTDKITTTIGKMQSPEYVLGQNKAADMLEAEQKIKAFRNIINNQYKK